MGGLGAASLGEALAVGWRALRGQQSGERRRKEEETLNPTAMRREISILPCLIAGLTLLDRIPAIFAAGESRPPNVVLIVADDLGYADLSCQGATDFATPNLDRMAREGVRLTSFYVAASVCSPSRAALLTGCYPDRVGVTEVYFPTRAPNGQGAGPGKAGLHPDEITLAEILQGRGYATACVGKWHLGDHPDFLPTKQGFDRVLRSSLLERHGLVGRECRPGSIATTRRCR